MPSQSAQIHSSADNSARTWDGSPQTKFEWFEQLRHTLATQNISFRTLWQSGYAVDRSKVLVSSELHAKHLTKGNVKKQPFDKPTPPSCFNLIDSTIDVSTVVPDTTRYVVAPEMIDAIDRSMFSAIANTISNPKRLEDYERKSDGSGLALIHILSKEIEESSAEISEWAARRLADVVSTGIQAPTTVAFDIFRKSYEQANLLMPISRRNCESVVADTYAAAARRLGENLGTRLDMQIMLTKMSKTGKDKTLSLEETVNCILLILADSELRETGQALKVSKPLQSNPLVWTEGKHETCSICKGKYGGGRHLRRDCPDKPTDPIKKPKSDRAIERDANAKGTAKRAAGSEEPEDVPLTDLWECDAPLSALFSDEPHHRTPSDHTELIDQSTPEGNACVAKGSDSQLRRPAPRAPNDSTPPGPNSAQQLVERLSPVSPMKQFTDVEKQINTRVSLRTGGSDRRSRIDILREMRTAVGLPALVIPVGLPVGPSASPPSDVAATFDSDEHTPHELLSTEATSALSTSVRHDNVSNPLELVWGTGAPRLKRFRVGTDDDGRVCHFYEFDTNDQPTIWSHLAGEIRSVQRPPARATYLGRSADHRTSFWGSNAGEIVCQNAPEFSSPPARVSINNLNNLNPTPPRQTAPNVMAAPTSDRRTRLSPVRELAVAVIALAGAVAAVSLAGTSELPSFPFEPGDKHDRSLSPALVISVVLVLMGATLACQANPPGGWGRTPHFSPTTPYTSPRWVPIYTYDRDHSHQVLVRLPKCWQNSLQLAWLALHYLTLCGLCKAALVFRLTMSRPGSRGREMLPQPELRRLNPIQRKAVWQLARSMLMVTFGAAIFGVNPIAGVTYLVTHTAIVLGRTPSSPPQPPTPRVARCHPSRPAGDVPPSPAGCGHALRGGSVKRTASTGELGWRSSRKVHKWMDFVVDSGCTWHIHNCLDDMINVKACGDTVEDAAGKRILCSKRGDLPLLVRSTRGAEFQFVLRDVRWAPSFPDSLLSVDQLWANSKADCVFRNQQRIEFTLNRDEQGDPLASAFNRKHGLFRWTVGILRSNDERSPSADGSARKLKEGIHAAGSTAHVAALPADSLAKLLHRRLHIGTQHLRQLGELASDVPGHISRAQPITCSRCAEANSTRLSHTHSSYEPTHPGRLIHVDIAGPFKPSYHGGFRYCLLIVDDHSRFKFAYALHKRSDGAAKIKRFVADFNALASEHSDLPISAVMKLRSDNAGEFVSREFKELLDDLGVAHVTSPPHISQLNGVAERAIRSVFTLARSYLAASGLPPDFWTHAVEMAVDVLNRTSGPQSSQDGRTSYEALTGRRPRVLGIMPFGCRAFAVKPRDQYSKTMIDPRAWIGVNLGRSALSPSAYKIWCPSTGRVVVTSDVYFMEHLYPRRPKGDQVDEEVLAVPTRPPAEGDPIGTTNNDGHALSLTASDGTSRVLVLFSGSYKRPDGLAAMLRRRGLEVVEVDNDPELCDANHDILNDDFFVKLLERARRGDFRCIFAAPPCSTYSVARYFNPKGGKVGAPVVRSREHILGIPQLPPGHEREVRLANEITRRTCLILSAARLAGADFAIENPADRGDATMPHLFQFAEHGPIWLDPHMINLRKSCHLSSTTFAQCMLGGATQKHTTVWYTHGLCTLDNLRGLWCRHSPGTHSQSAGGEYDESEQTWNSTRSAAYPTDMNALLCDAVVDAITSANSLFHSPPMTASRQSPDLGKAPEPMSVEPFRAPPGEEVTSFPVIDPSPASGGSDPNSSERVDSPSKTPDSPTGDSPPTDANAPTPFVPKRKYQRRVFETKEFGLRPNRVRNYFSKVARASSSDPANHAEAMAADALGWGEAEAKEILNHETNGSWQYISRSELPQGRRVVKLTWVFKTKRGETKKKKARLCVQGCSQVHGEDYDQTFCAALRAGSLRTLCALAARLNLKMHRWDFVAAYLQGDLEPGEVVYCSPPAGFGTALNNDGIVHLVPKDQADGVPRLCRVMRPVYGMAQAGRRWQRTLFPWLLSWENGGASFKQSSHDTCVFHCRQTVQTADGPRDEVLLVGCYVDDLFVLASHTDEQSLYHRFTQDLSNSWDVEDEGPVHDLLSIEIEHSGQSVQLRQTGYIEKLMATYAPEGKPASPLGKAKLTSQPASRTPAGQELPQLVADALTQDATSVDPTLLKSYQSLVGALLYCAVNTRPDVAYSVGMLCRAMGKPTLELLDAAYRVLYYLHHHKHVGLHYSACELDLSGMSDSDWSSSYSTSGYVFTYSQAAISWSSKKQPCVALSSCEAEMVALSEAAKEGVYLSRFLSDLGFPPTQTVSLATDNSAARDLSYNPEHHERTKHIERRHFFVRDMVESHQLVVPYVCTTSNLADFFTKPLAAADFYRLRNAIMNLPARSDSTLARAGGCSK